MADLKPCPFCGSEVGLEHSLRYGDKEGSSVWCRKCGIEGEWFCKSFRYSSDDKAIAAWNRRVKGGDDNG